MSAIGEMRYYRQVIGELKTELAAESCPFNRGLIQKQIKDYEDDYRAAYLLARDDTYEPHSRDPFDDYQGEDLDNG